MDSNAQGWIWAPATHLLDGLHHSNCLASARGAKDEVWGWPGHPRHDVGHSFALLLVGLQLAVKPPVGAEAALPKPHRLHPLTPQSLPPCRTATHRGWKGPGKRDLWQEAEGKRRLDKPRRTASTAARCCTCRGSRLKVKVTSNFRFFTNFFCSLGRNGVSRARGTLPCPPGPFQPTPGLWHL